MTKSRNRMRRLGRAVLFSKFAGGQAGCPRFLAPAAPVPKPSMKALWQRDLFRQRSRNASHSEDRP